MPLSLDCRRCAFPKWTVSDADSSTSSAAPSRMHRTITATTTATFSFARTLHHPLRIRSLHSHRISLVPMATPLTSSAAVTRQRSFGLSLLSSVPIVGIQEGSSAISIKEEGVAKATAAAAGSDDAAAQLQDPLAQLDLHSFRVSSSFLCTTCRVAFASAEELRTHSKTAWHVHNVRTKTGAAAEAHADLLSEVEFEEMQQQQQKPSAAEDDSASSGASSDEENDSHQRSQRAASASDDEESDSVGSNRVTFYTPSQRLTVWKHMLLHPSSPPAHLPLQMKALAYVQALRELQQVRQVVVLMVSGGRFSGAVFRDSALLVSKNFERYTTRRKQGGSQSAHDNAKGAAQSIGSSIRRKETVRFWEETARIVSEWGELIAGAQRIFIFAPGANRQQLMRSLDKSDPRVRNVPFPTYRPALLEVQRIHQWITTVEFEDRKNAPRDLESQIASANAAGEKPASGSKKAQQQAAAAAASAGSTAAAASTPVSALSSLPTPVLDDALLNAVRDGSLDTVQQLLSTGYARPVQAGSPRFRPLLYHAVAHGQAAVAAWLLQSGAAVGDEGPDEQVVDASDDARKIVCWGALHRACVDANEAIVLALLQHGADPTLRDSRNRLPFTLLPSTPAGAATRLAVRRLAGSTPEWLARWDWADAAELPPLTAEAEAAAEEAKRVKAREKKKAQKEKAKVRAAEKQESASAAASAAEAVRAAQQAQALRESAQAVREATSARAQSMAQLSDREKRALAAERRMGAAKGTGPACALCQLALTKTPFERLQFKYCSIACLQQHKLEIDAKGAAGGSATAGGTKQSTFNPK